MLSASMISGLYRMLLESGYFCKPIVWQKKAYDAIPDMEFNGWIMKLKPSTVKAGSFKQALIGLKSCLRVWFKQTNWYRLTDR